MFIYTRTQSQNAGSIWGRYFPGFAEKEDRLPDVGEIAAWTDASDLLSAPKVQLFRYQRRATLAELVRQVRGRHYSTFSMYAPAELEGALVRFEQTIRETFPDPDRVEWEDENVMVVYRRAGSGVR